MNRKENLVNSRSPFKRQRVFGGIAPDPRKARPLRSRIMPMPLPPHFVLPLRQYNGNSCVPLVRVGDRVLKYQVLARPADSIGTPLHAPSSGSISAISTAPVAGLPGDTAICIHLECDGKDDSLELQPCSNPAQLTSAEILRKIEAAGIVGMGGAGFPTALKITMAAEHDTEVLIINAAECEPYICCDEALLRERAKAVVAGAELIRTACHAPRCVIAIETNKSDAIGALRLELTHSATQLLLLEDVYPAGSEKQLIKAVTGLEVPAGSHPVELGILVQNVGTAYAVYQAVAEGKPSISRITTLAGDALLTPKNFEALVGTPISFLMNLCGVDASIHQTTVLGGSLMGVQLDRTDLPITKTSNCLIAATVAEFPAPEPERACIRCGFCAAACPAQLLPQQLYNFARSHNHSQLESYGLQDCIECGACAYVCPSRIPLVQYYLAAKQEIQELQIHQIQGENWQARFQLHQYRTRKEKDLALEQRAEKPAKSEAIKQQEVTGFSRTDARREIAEAVARAAAKKAAAQKLSAKISSSKNEGQH